jgi:hypothetical protein
MHKLIKFFRIISLGIFLAILLYIYAVLPERVLIFKEGTYSHYMTKDTFFYSTLGVFFFVNVLIFAAIYFLRGFLYSNLRVMVISWLNGFSTVLNLFFGLAILAILVINIGSSNVYAGAFFYGGLSLVFIWLLLLVYVFKKVGIETANE